MDNDVLSNNIDSDTIHDSVSGFSDREVSDNQNASKEEMEGFHESNINGFKTMNTHSFKIMDEALEDYGPLNRAKVAEGVGVTSPGLYYNFIGKRRWFVDTWLYALACLGRVKVRGDHIIVKTPLAQDLAPRIRALSSQSYSVDTAEKAPQENHSDG